MRGLRRRDGAARPLGPGYRRLWSASSVSNLGDGVALIAYPWLASLLTREAALVAGVTVAQRLPWLLFSLHAGALVDRLDRRRLMVATNAVRCLVTLGVALCVQLDAMTVGVLYAAVLVLGTAEVLYDNAAQTILPALVPRDRLERANGNLYGAEMLMNSVVGPPLGGLLIGLAVAAPFALDAATFGISALLVLSISGRFGAPPGAAAPRRRLRQDIAEGVRWLWSHRLLRTLALLLGVMNGMSAGMLAVEVLFVQELLGLSAAGYGLLATAGAVGGIAGSQLAPAITRRTGPGRALYLTLAAGSLTSLLIGLTSSVVVFAAASLLFTFMAFVWNVVTVSLRQSLVPDRLLGRVNSVYRLLGWGSMPLGALLAGAVVSLAEPSTGRELALRLPFLLSAAVHALALAWAVGRISTARIRAAESAPAG